MKIMLASDIHGSAFYCGKLVRRFEAEKCSRLVLLGDILYHGPRNSLPEGYDPQKTAEILNGISDKIVCVRGNCDSEVDQMMLKFPVLSGYGILCVGERVIFLSHGHNIPENLAGADVLASGHTHIPLCEKTDSGKPVHINPGSVSIPKEASAHSYMTFDGKEFLWKKLENGEAYNSFLFDD